MSLCSKMGVLLKPMFKGYGCACPSPESYPLISLFKSCWPLGKRHSCVITTHTHTHLCFAGGSAVVCWEHLAVRRDCVGACFSSGWTAGPVLTCQGYLLPLHLFPRPFILIQRGGKKKSSAGVKIFIAPNYRG